MNRYFIFYIIAVFCVLTSCKKATSTSTMIIPTKKSSVPKKLVKTDFEQGVLYYDLSISDTILQSFIDLMANNATYVKDSHYNQSQDSVYLKNFIAQNPDFWQKVGYFPFMKNQVYISGYEAVYKGETLSLKVENTYNDLLEKGYLYMGSKLGLKSSVNAHYSLNTPIINQVQYAIDLHHYTQEEQRDSTNILGYPTKVSSYVLKPEVFSKDLSLPYQIRVYQSEAFHHSLNRVLPFYMDLPNGILQVDFKLDAKDAYCFSFMANSIVQRQVLPQESMVTVGQGLFDLTSSQDKDNFEKQLHILRELPKVGQ